MKKTFCLLIVSVIIAFCLLGCNSDPPPAETSSPPPAPSADAHPPETSEELPAPDHYVATFYGSDESITTLSELIRNRLYHPEQPYTYGNFRLFEQAAGFESELLVAHLFQFEGFDFMELDWASATDDPSGLFSDASLMIQLESIDGTWYAQFHDGQDAHWVYISECSLYVPLKLTQTIGDYSDAAAFMNAQILRDYSAWLFSGHCISNYGCGTPQETAEAYCLLQTEAMLRAAQEDRTGVYNYSDVTADDLTCSVQEDGSILVSFTAAFTPRNGEPLNFLVDPDGNTLLCEATLVQLSDGNWYTYEHLYWLPVVFPDG